MGGMGDAVAYLFVGDRLGSSKAMEHHTQSQGRKIIFFLLYSHLPYISQLPDLAGRGWGDQKLLDFCSLH